jgi:hypothetical protein
VSAPKPSEARNSSASSSTDVRAPERMTATVTVHSPTLLDVELNGIPLGRVSSREEAREAITATMLARYGLRPDPLDAPVVPDHPALRRR